MTTSRRTVTRGAVWSVPAVMTGAAAPALAASGSGKVALARKTFYTAPTTGCSNGQYKLNWDGTNTAGGYGVILTNTKAKDAVVSGLYIVFWVSVDNLALITSTSTPQWGAPTATKQSQQIGGRTYYQYKSTYTGSVTVPANSSTAVKYAFNGSVCRSGLTYITAGQAFATADGVAIQSDPGTATTCSANNCS